MRTSRAWKKRGWHIGAMPHFVMKSIVGADEMATL